MINKVLKRITKFYQFSLVLLMVVTMGSVFYFWNLGFIDGSKGKELHKASFILESYSKNNKFTEVNDLIFSENPKKAIAKIKEFEKELETVDRHVGTKEFDGVKENIQSLKSSAAKLISFSKSEKVISVFTKKLHKFHAYVKGNNWRTLTRMSDRIYSKVSGHLNKKKLASLSKSILRDFNSMIKITENSILSRKDKSEIVSRITNLQIEMEMLKKYSTKRSEFNTSYVVLNKAISDWTKKISPEITLNKIKVEDIGRYYVMGMLAILFMTSVIFVLSFMMNKWFYKKSKEDVEEGIETYINEGIIAGDRSVFHGYSNEFQYFSENIAAYIDKRMSFGTIFQDALPLSSILLDENLKVIWANKQFCDDWQISDDEIKKDYMSWDYLNKLTNLGHDDPILEALKHNIAGIYQVQVKPNDNADVRPYEMFVSPIKNKGENRIMLFFYDLTNLEATIKDQSISILNPVKHSVENLIKGQFVASEQMEYEFKIAGIAEIYEKFIALNEDIIKNENELIDQIESSELKVKKLKNYIGNIDQKNKETVELNRDNINALKVFKDNVIGLSELTKVLDDLCTKSEELVNTNINALRNSAGKVSSLKTVTAELVEAMPRFYKIKEEIKDTKNIITDARGKLSHELSQLSILMKRAENTSSLHKLQRTLGKINESFTLLNKTSDDLDKKLSALDVIMSKAQMIMNSGYEKINAVTADYENSQVHYSSDLVKSIRQTKAGSSQKIEDYESQIVNSLGLIFNASKENVKICGDISHIHQQAGNISEAGQISH